MDNKNTKEENLHKNHRQRMKEKFSRLGFDAFTDVEKLEFILFYTIAQKNTNPIAHRLMNEFGSFDAVLEAPVHKLLKVEGVGEHSAYFLNSLLQIASAYGKSKNVQIIGSTTAAKVYSRNLLSHKPVEEFYVFCLGPNGKVLSSKLIGIGTTGTAQVQIREITKAALDCNSERVIIAHNHPQGRAIPSDEDVAFTNKVIFSCFTNNIDVLDHIIISPQEELSFLESNVLQTIKENAIRSLRINGMFRTKLLESSESYINDRA